jgi:TonB family protein
MESAVHLKNVFLCRGGIVSLQTIVRRVRNLVLFVLVLTTLSGTFPPAGLAQDGVDRKVKSKVSPVYPEIARKMGITGNVKLQLVVAPNGAVKETKVIGGHPILVNAAVDAVKKWRFETASAESTGTVEFRFDPGN